MQKEQNSENTPINRPAVSVAMAAYNGEKYISAQIESILFCLSAGDELVVSDDGSTDKTAEIVKTYAAKDPRVKLLQGPQSGVVRNFENAISACTGDVIFLSDQDDLWHKDKVEKVLPLLKENTLVCHNAAIYDNATGQTDGTVQDKIGQNATVFKNLVKNSFMGCCMAFKRELLNYAMPFPDKELIHIHDWWLGLLAIKYGKVAFISECLIDYRIHDSNTLGFNKTTFGFKVKKRVNMLNTYRKRIKMIKKSK